MNWFGRGARARAGGPSDGRADRRSDRRRSSCRRSLPREGSRRRSSPLAGLSRRRGCVGAAVLRERSRRAHRRGRAGDAARPDALVRLRRQRALPRGADRESRVPRAVPARRARRLCRGRRPRCWRAINVLRGRRAASVAAAGPTWSARGCGRVRRIGIALAVAMGARRGDGARRSESRVPALVLAGGLSMAWNGLSFTAAAEPPGGRGAARDRLPADGALGCRRRRRRPASRGPWSWPPRGGRLRRGGGRARSPAGGPSAA